MRAFGLQGTWVVMKRELLTHLKSPRLLIMGSLFALLVVGGAYGISGGFGGASGGLQRQSFAHVVNASDGPSAVVFVCDLFGAPLQDQRFDLVRREIGPPPTYPIVETTLESKRSDANGFARFGPLNSTLLQNGSLGLQEWALLAGEWTMVGSLGLFPSPPTNVSVQIVTVSQETGFPGTGNDLLVHVLDWEGNPAAAAQVYLDDNLAGNPNAQGLFIAEDLPAPDPPAQEVVNVTVVLGTDRYETIALVTSAPGGLGLNNPDTAVLFMSGLIGFLAPIFAIVVAFDGVVKERVHGTMDLLLSRPATREGVALGKFLGSLAAVSVPAVVVNTIGLAIIAQSFGRAPTGPLAAAFVLGVVLLAAVFILLQQTLSTLAKSSSTAVLYGVLLWLVFTILFQIVLFLVALALGISIFSPEFQQLSNNASFVNPAGVFQLVVLASAPDIARSTGFFAGAFAVPLWAPYVAAAAWFVATFLLALFTFRKKAVE